MPSSTPMPPGPPRALVGVAEVAELLGVSRQRADVLTRTKGFPEPVALVAPWDDEERVKIRELDAAGVLPLTLAEVMAYMDENAFRLPETPRLWRRESVIKWAEAAGRELHDDDTDAAPGDLAPAANRKPRKRKT
ncbi:MAG: hypothetical protein ACLPYY_01605 [Acidimicrobiales bacterium]